MRALLTEGKSLMILEGRKSSVLALILFGGLALISWGEMAHGSPDVSPQTGVGLLETVSGMAVPEPADAVLVHTREWKWNRYLKAVLRLPAWMDLGLEHRTRFETYDHPWRPSQPSGQTDSQIQQRSRVRLGLNGKNLKFLFEGQDARVYLDNVESYVTTGIRNEMDVLQLMASFTLDNVLRAGLRTDLHVGRLTMDFGRGRLIIRNDYRNTSNAFDGVHWQLGRDQRWRVRLFLVEPVLRDEVQPDEQSKRSVFWGGFIETEHMPRLGLNAYYFGLNDQRSANVGRHRTFSTFGTRLYDDPKPGRIDYEIEGVVQTGKKGNVNHFAHFQHIVIGYTLALPWSPRFLIHYDYASGDRSAQDSQSSAFDTLFGARRFDYMPTGNFGPFFRTNFSSPGWRVIVVPCQGCEVQLKHRVWYLATSRGAFGGNGLHDPTGGSGNFLGHDLELRAHWKTNDNLEFELGYTHWFKGSYLERLPDSAGLPPGGNRDSDYFYIQTKFRL